MILDEYVYKTSIDIMLNITKRKVFVNIQNGDKDLISELCYHWEGRGFKVCQSMLQTEDELEW